MAGGGAPGAVGGRDGGRRGYRGREGQGWREEGLQGPWGAGMAGGGATGAMGRWGDGRRASMGFSDIYFLSKDVAKSFLHLKLKVMSNLANISRFYLPLLNLHFLYIVSKCE